jgi:hypothetical protein
VAVVVALEMVPQVQLVVALVVVAVVRKAAKELLEAQILAAAVAVQDLMELLLVAVPLVVQELLLFQYQLQIIQDNFQEQPLQLMVAILF